jgi:hypothetical protein
MGNKKLNVWIDKKGKVTHVGMMGHIIYALDYLEGKEIDHYKYTGNDYLVEVLGFVKISTWWDSGTFICPEPCKNKYTKRQIKSIVKLYTDYGLRLPKELKGE